ncbi:hypothetical protein JW935_03955 [candidate division KSB1 bacterium]|nr:hypothetical protein [candidate division KSB1 bacterium]
MKNHKHTGVAYFFSPFSIRDTTHNHFFFKQAAEQDHPALRHNTVQGTGKSRRLSTRPKRQQPGSLRSRRRIIPRPATVFILFGSVGQRRRAQLDRIPTSGIAVAVPNYAEKNSDYGSRKCIIIPRLVTCDYPGVF